MAGVQIGQIVNLGVIPDSSPTNLSGFTAADYAHAAAIAAIWARYNAQVAASGRLLDVQLALLSNSAVNVLGFYAAVNEIAANIAISFVTPPSSALRFGSLAGEVATVTAGAPPALSAAQASNLARFTSKIPAGSTGVAIDLLGDGVLFTAKVPGNVPGSYAVYQKSVDAAGQTTTFLKTTFAPNGSVVHIKDKISGALIPTN